MLEMLAMLVFTLELLVRLFPWIVGVLVFLAVVGWIVGRDSK